MNQSDRKEFDLIHEKIDTIKNTMNEIKVHNEAEHMKNRTDLKFIKDNLFNPHQGLWAETKLNTQFRQSTSKWRGIVGTGFIGLFVSNTYGICFSRKMYDHYKIVLEPAIKINHKKKKPRNRE